MIGLMDLTSHPEISGSTNTTHGHAQRGTGSLVQPTSVWALRVSYHWAQSPARQSIAGGPAAPMDLLIFSTSTMEDISSCFME